MTLNLNDLMIFLESQFIQEQHAQAVSFRRHWSPQLVTQMGAKHWHCHRIWSGPTFYLHFCRIQPGMCGKKLGTGGQWVVTGGGVVTTCDHRPPYQHQHQPCNSLPSSARTRPIYEVPQPHHTLPIKVVFCPIGMFYPSPRFSVSPGRGRGCFCRVFLCDTSGGAASLGSHTARVTTCPLSSLNTDRSLLCLKC